MNCVSSKNSAEPFNILPEAQAQESKQSWQRANSLKMNVAYNIVEAPT
jgi:hypothetical protein